MMESVIKLPPMLIIIDMQPDFKAARSNKTTKAVVREIEYFKSREHPIMVVEYDGCQPTRRPIMRALEGYRQVYMVTKYDDSGARAICQAIVKHKLALSRLVICGVNTCACVHETTNDLAYVLGMEMPIDLVNDGCNCECGRYAAKKKKCHPLYCLETYPQVQLR